MPVSPYLYPFSHIEYSHLEFLVDVLLTDEKIDTQVFKQDTLVSLLCSIDHPDVNDSEFGILNNLVKIYNDTLQQQLNKHAPLKTKSIKVRQVVSWMNDIKDLKRNV